jgi:hypothetical protein
MPPGAVPSWMMAPGIIVDARAVANVCSAKLLLAVGRNGGRPPQCRLFPSSASGIGIRIRPLEVASGPFEGRSAVGPFASGRGERRIFPKPAAPMSGVGGIGAARRRAPQLSAWFPAVKA